MFPLARELAGKERELLRQNPVVVGKAMENAMSDERRVVPPLFQLSDERENCTGTTIAHPKLDNACSFDRRVVLHENCLNRGHRDEASTHLKRVFGSVVGRLHDRSTTLNTSSRGRRATEKAHRFGFSFELDGTVFLVGVSSSMGVFVSVQSVFRTPHNKNTGLWSNIDTSSGSNPRFST